VADALDADDLAQARQCVAHMVSRETAQMQATDVARATVESVLENGNDALFGAVFWFAVAGAPGVVLYRLANTLDAMWGYRTDRYLHFGWAAARLDDALNFVPARLTALSYALCGRFPVAFACWRAQAPAWASPNAGPVMAAGAGALGIELGGPAKYDGQWHLRPALGVGHGASADDIGAALKLVRNSLWLWLGIVLLLGASAQLMESFHA
jgi:adenosylcobinamide-phosphate synthase